MILRLRFCNHGRPSSHVDWLRRLRQYSKSHYWVCKRKWGTSLIRHPFLQDDRMSTWEYQYQDLQITMLALVEKLISHILFVLQSLIANLVRRKYKYLICPSYHRTPSMTNLETCNSQQNNVFLIGLEIISLNLWIYHRNQVLLSPYALTPPAATLTN